MPIIDVHTHNLPAAYLDALSAAGIQDVEGYALPEWSERQHLEAMDQYGINSSVLSISAPGLQFISGAAARDLARRLNEAAAERRERTKGRFGAFALTVLPDVEGALLEMEYALDTLKLDGVGLLTNYHGTYLGDPSFDEFFKEAERRGAVLFVHPVAPPNYQQLVLGYSASVLEYPFDTVRMLQNLVATGTLRRHPKLKIIACHGGGAMPFLAWRITNIAPMFNRLTPPITSAEAEEQLKRIYYDCTAVCNVDAFVSYRSFVPSERRLFGGDFPFMPASSMAPAIKFLESSKTLDSSECKALEWKNAAELFPGLVKLLNL